MKVLWLVVVVLFAVPTTGAMAPFASASAIGHSVSPVEAYSELPAPRLGQFPSNTGAALSSSSNGSMNWSGQSYGIWIAAYSGLMVREVDTDLGSYLHSGDGVALVLQGGDFSELNSEATSVHTALPYVTLRAYTSLDGGTGKADGITKTINRFSPLFRQLSADYEVHGPVEFSANYTKALEYFVNFTQTVNRAGFQSIAYPSGRSVLGGQYGWNYGGFANVTDGQTIETQAFCGSPWKAAASKVWSEYNTTDVSMRTLSLQVSLGPGRCSEWQAIHAAKYWRQLTHGNVFFWWEPGELRELETVLRIVEH